MTVEGFVRHVHEVIKGAEGEAYGISLSSFGVGIEENPKLIAQSKLMELNGKYIDIWNGCCD